MKTYTVYLSRTLSWTPRHRGEKKRVVFRANSAKHALSLIKSLLPEWHLHMFWMNWP